MVRRTACVLEKMKRCTKCGVEKSATAQNFGRDGKAKDGFFYWCRPCVAAHGAVYYARNRARIIAMAVIKKRERRAWDTALVERERKWARERKRKKHSDPVAYEQHLKRGREWRHANPDRVKGFKHQAPEKAAARQRIRAARMRRATPSWADRSVIAEFYNLARQLTAKTGVRHEVDHMIPLWGRSVCGLHVETNLQVVPHYVNERKSRKLLPEFS